MCKERLLKLMKNLFFSPDDAPTLQFSLKYMELDDSYFFMIYTLLKQHPYIETLDLEGNFFSDASILQL